MLRSKMFYVFSLKRDLHTKLKSKIAKDCQDWQYAGTYDTNIDPCNVLSRKYDIVFSLASNYVDGDFN